MVIEAVADVLADHFRGRVPTVEQIQDAVERQLWAGGLDDVTRAYIVSRAARAGLREAKALLQFLSNSPTLMNTGTALHSCLAVWCCR